MKSRRMLSLGIVVISLLTLFSVLTLYSQAGAAGPPSAQSSGPFPPSEPNAPIHWPQRTGSQADEVEGPQQTWRYYHVPGAVFQPRDSTTGYAYQGNGCIAGMSNATLLFNTELLLPEGATIKYLRLYYYDASPGTMQEAWITRYYVEGGIRRTEDLLYLPSAGAPGYTDTLSLEITHTVDPYPNGYVLNWRSNATDNSQQLCAMRVAYFAPPRFEGLLPAVRFDRNTLP
jgi:hypothetical protein